MSTEQVVERPVETRTDVAALLAGLVIVTLWGSRSSPSEGGESISPRSSAITAERARPSCESQVQISNL